MVDRTIDHIYMNSIEFPLDVAFGRVKGWSAGFNFAVKRPITNQSVSGTLWGSAGYLPGDHYNWLGSATQLQVSSGSASDSGKPVTIVGLDSDWNSITETVTLSGQTPASTLNSFLRVNDFFGGADALSDIIYLSVDGAAVSSGIPDDGTQVLSFIGISGEDEGPDAGFLSDRNARIGVLSVPDNKALIVKSIRISAGDGGEVTFHGRVRRFGEQSWTDRYPLPVSNNTVEAVEGLPLIIPARTDLELRATKISSGSTFVVAKTAYYMVDYNTDFATLTEDGWVVNR